jgi:hypothetical protein
MLWIQADFFALAKAAMPLGRALDTLVIDLSMGHFEGNSPDDFAPRATARFAARLAFVRRFKGILDKLSGRLNEERTKIFVIVVIVVVFESSLI